MQTIIQHKLQFVELDKLILNNIHIFIFIAYIGGSKFASTRVSEKENIGAQAQRTSTNLQS